MSYQVTYANNLFSTLDEKLSELISVVQVVAPLWILPLWWLMLCLPALIVAKFQVSFPITITTTGFVFSVLCWAIARHQPTESDCGKPVHSDPSDDPGLELLRKDSVSNVETQSGLPEFANAFEESQQSDASSLNNTDEDESGDSGYFENLLVVQDEDGNSSGDSTDDRAGTDSFAWEEDSAEEAKDSEASAPNCEEEKS
jgi:hypothetical protein